ncbi:MAG: YccF domain-containing protein [Anaerolineaceae bacterium]|nr:YccF domain-containing protein [Anaerolineaceae bacterium]
MANSSVYIEQERGPGLLIRALYFIFVGLWLGGIWTTIAWVLVVSIIGLPLGLMMLNRIPQIMTLKPVRENRYMVEQDGRWVMRKYTKEQPSFLARALYFLLIGWWFSALWLLSAWAIAGITLGLGLPLSFWMFDRVPAITTLSRF